MAGFAGLKTPYALFIIILMVLGVIAGAFYFYNAANQNPCGNPGPAHFSALPDETISVNSQFYIEQHYLDDCLYRVDTGGLVVCQLLLNFR